jgi:hypothetical protein
MATTTKPTRKKPAKAPRAAKVTKSTTKKSAVKSAGAKTSSRTKKTTVIKGNGKASAATVSAKTVKGPLSPFERLRSLHITSAALYLIFAGLVIGFTTTLSKAITLPIHARDEFASKDHVVLGSAQEVLFNIEPKYVLAASLVTAAIASILFATKLRSRYEATVANRTSGFRWVALGISAALLIDYVALLAGVTDIWAWKLSGALVFITCMLSWFAERDNAGSRVPKRLAFDLSLLTGFLAWLPILGSLIGTSVYGMERFGWPVYAIAAVTLLGFTAFALNLRSSFRESGRQKVYTSIEERYLRLDLFTKFAVVLLTLIAFK